MLVGCAETPTPAPTPTPQARTPTAGPEARITPVTPLPPGQGAPPVHVWVPSLGVDVAVRPVGWEIVSTATGRYTEWQVLPDAAGHHLGSANPGERGNVVLSGHNTPGGRVFEGLATLGYEEGPIAANTFAYVQTEDGRIYAYRLENKVLLPVLGVSPEERRSYLKYTAPTDEPRLTLVTCWPLGDTSYRLVVWGPLVGMVLSVQP